MHNLVLLAAVCCIPWKDLLRLLTKDHFLCENAVYIFEHQISGVVTEALEHVLI
jgi:hypothetical protein